MQNDNAKSKINLSWLLPLSLVFLFCVLSVAPQGVLASGASNFKIEILALCGNNIKEIGEQCDAGGSNGSCPAACSASCTTNSCGGGGGGSGGSYIAPTTSIVFEGRAYPKSTVILLKDAQIAATAIADADANFQISISGLFGGNYIFSVYSEDNKGNRSSLLTFPVNVTSGATTNVSGIFIAPTIAVDKSEVKQGDNIAIWGQSIADSEITISINSKEEEFFVKTKTGKDGMYLYNLNTLPLEIAQYFIKSKTTLNGETSPFSESASFIVGTKNVVAQLPTKALAKVNLNSDNPVKVIDKSGNKMEILPLPQKPLLCSCSCYKNYLILIIILILAAAIAYLARKILWKKRRK
jgi:hypothetical protein